MMYLYHSVPKNLEGNILYPLNILKERFPHIYEEQVLKYVGREQVLSQQIPILNCLWNDVLHFSPVNPTEVKQALMEAGRTNEFTMNCYQVDPNLIDPQSAIVYLYVYADNGDKMNEKNFVPYNSEKIEKFSSLPQSTKDYYKKMIDKHERPLLYHRVPHILYKGTLDITNLPIISV